MNIGIIGSGRIGSTMARLLVPNGHQGAISNRSGALSVGQLANELGPNLHPMTVEGAASFGDSFSQYPLSPTIHCRFLPLPGESQSMQ